jgi:DNA end-binding protein Ku
MARRGHKQQYVDSETGEIVDRENRVKGYEVGKGDYVTVSDEELAAIEIESSHTIDIESFVPKSDVDPVYFDNRYFIAPDDKIGQEAFAVIREAMRQRGRRYCPRRAPWTRAVDSARTESERNHGHDVASQL